MNYVIQLLNDVMNVMEIGMGGILVIVVLTAMYLVTEVARFEDEGDVQ